MDESSVWRQEVAIQVAQKHQSNPNITAIMLGGSTARGHTDKYSDIELGVFWNQPPTEEERMAAYQLTNADLIQIYPYYPDEEVWCDDFMVGRAAPNHPQTGILVEVAHHTTEMIDRVLIDVIQNHNPDEGKQNLISGIIDGVPLHGEFLINRWKQKVTPYPEKLAMAVAKKHAQIDHFWRWKMFLASSQNLMLLYQLFSQVEIKLLHMLLGLNRVYFFDFKWIDEVIDRLTISPPQLLPRLRQIYTASPEEGAHLLTELVDETYDLIEIHFPSLEVSWYREVFHYQRPLWVDPPPYSITK